MKIAKIIALGIWLSAAAAMGDSPTTKPTPFVKAIRVLHIYSPPEYADAVVSFNFGRIGGVPYGTVDVKQKAVPNGVVVRVTVEERPPLMVGPGSFFQDAPAEADQYVQTIDQKLADQTEAMREDWRNQLSQARATDRHLLDLRGEVADKLAELNEIRGSAGNLADSSEDGIRTLGRALDSEDETAQLDIAGKTARRGALTDAMARLNLQISAKIQADPIAQQLQDVVDARQKEMDRIKSLMSQGTATPQQLDEATADLAQAKAALLERQDAAAKAAGADLLSQWNQELLSLSIDLAELHARSDAVGARLQRFSRVLDQMQRFPSEESLRASFDRIDSQLQDVVPLINTLTQNLADQNLPKVTVIESHNE